MENKLPDDQLEHFLRNSFKDYTEKPSEDVWDKIDYSLDHQVSKTPSNRKWIWMLSAAAVAGIIVYLGANNIYLNNKLRKEIEFNKSIVHNQIENASDKTEIKNSIPGQDTSTTNDAKTNDKEINKESNPIPPSVTQLSDDATEQPGKLKATGSIANKEDSFVTSSSASQQKANTSKPLIPDRAPLAISPSTETRIKNQIAQSNQTTADNKNISSGRKQNLKKSTTRSELTENQNFQAPIEGTNPGTKKTDKNIQTNKKETALRSFTESVKLNETKSIKVPDTNMDEKIDAHEAIVTLQEKRNDVRRSINVDGLPQTSMNLYSLSGSRSIPVGTLSGMIPVKIPTSSHWAEWSLQGGIIQESGSLTDLRRPNNPLINPTENTFTTTNSWTAGVGYSKSLSDHLFVSTGLAFKNYELINTINQSLSFGGRINPAPGSMPLHHDWNFKLNCPGGTSNIMIQSEQLDSRATISDNEQVKVNITNTEKLNYLTIPLAMNYRGTLGKITWMAGAGLHMNILTKSSFEEPAIKINHPQLKTRTEPHTNYRFDKSNPVVWNGTISAGIAYAIAPKISLQLSPSWFIPITNRNSDHDVKVNSTSYSLQLGLNYSLASL